MCGEQHPKTWLWDPKAMECGARRSDRAALQVLHVTHTVVVDTSQEL